MRKLLSILLVLSSVFGTAGNNDIFSKSVKSLENEIVVEKPVAFENEVNKLSVGYGSEVINLWSFTDEITNMVSYYFSQNPEFAERYTVDCTVIATDGGAYQQALDAALVAGGDSAPDIYAAEAEIICHIVV